MTSDLRTAFDRGSSHYDLLVSLNPGYHRHLREAAGELAGPLAASGPARVLDLACGSGASTAALTHALPAGSRIHGVDLSPGMLAQVRSRAWPDGVTFAEGRAGALDTASLGEGTWDAVFASYLFRNIPTDQRDGALAEVLRLLRPGGRLVTQEYVIAGDRSAGLRWTAVCWGIILPLGIAIDHNADLYRYLWRSAQRFDSRTAFMDRMAAAGFGGVAVRTVGGWQRGILHTFVGRRVA